MYTRHNKLVLLLMCGLMLSLQACTLEPSELSARAFALECDADVCPAEADVSDTDISTDDGDVAEDVAEDGGLEGDTADIEDVLDEADVDQADVDEPDAETGRDTDFSIDDVIQGPSEPPASPDALEGSLQGSTCSAIYPATPLPGSLLTLMTFLGALLLGRRKQKV